MNSYWHLSAAIVLMFPLAANAQIVPDNTMGSQVTQIRINNVLSDKVDGGTIRGNNLFHSFSEFNILSGRGVYFDSTNASNITNIFTRVTGANPSNINGVLGVLGDANLFLMNPNGIVFGSGGKLDLKGSFIATTASSINFADGSVFSTNTNPKPTTPLLSVTVPVGLGFGSVSSEIQVQGVGSNLTTTDVTFTPYTTLGASQNGYTGLQVQPGKTLALIGGEINLNGGVLTAPGGHIELGSVGAGSKVDLNSTTQGLKFDYSNAANLQNIQLSQKALVNVSGINAGSVQVQANQISIREGANIWSQNRGAQPGGDINILAANLLEVNGTTPDEKLRSGIMSETINLGASGNIAISTSKLAMQNGATIATRTYSLGKSGNVTVNASEFVEMQGLSPKTNVYNVLGSVTYFASLPENKPVSTAKAGDVTVSTPRLSIKDASYLTAISFGDSSGGNLKINTDTTEVIGGSVRVAGLNDFLASAISSIGYRRGNSGNITLDTRALTVQDGAIISTTNLGTSNAGNVTINASKSIEVAGILSDNGNILSASNISSTIGSPSPSVQQLPTYRALGDAGSVTINTPSLKMLNGGSVSVENFGNVGAAGQLTINVKLLQLSNYAGIIASSVSGKEGNIILKADNLQMRRQSQIATNAFGTGDGGNITINADTIIQLENSDITANAIKGKGGNINIGAQSIFSSPDSLRTATGSMNGEVKITTPNINQDNSLKQQSNEIIKTEQVIATSCLVNRNEEQGSFVTTGNGGLPQAPNNDFDLAYTVTQIHPVISVATNTQKTQDNSNWKHGDRIQEATKLIKTAEGRIILATTNNNMSPTTLTCNY